MKTLLNLTSNTTTNMRNILVFISFITLFFTSLIGYSQATVYITADDYGKEETTIYKEVALVNNSLIFSSEDGSVKVFNLKKEKVWGFRNNFGEDFRIKKSGAALRIIEYGDICIYSTVNGISTTSNPDLNPGWEDKPYALSKFQRFSIGANGKIIKFSNTRFLRALKGHSAYEKFKKLIISGNGELLLKVIEHNASN